MCPSNLGRVQTLQWQWRSGAVAQWRSGAVAQWRSGAVAQWRSGAVAQWRSGAVAQWRSGAVAQWRSGAVAQWRSGAVAQWRSGAVAQWRSGAVAQWRSGAVAQWRSGAVAQWRSGAVAQWRSASNKKTGVRIQLCCSVGRCDSSFTVYLNRCGRPKQKTSCCADRSDIGRWHSCTCCVILYRATFVGRGRDWLSEHAWLSFERSWDVDEYVAPCKSNSKAAHLTGSKLMQF